jgi:ammonia channel protein AmtB
VFGAIICRQALRINFTDFAQRWRRVDVGDSFATHYVGGFVGTVATGLFAQKAVAAYDGATIIDGGVFFDGNLNQLWIQVMEALIGFTWSFVGSYLTFALIDCVPGFEVLANNDDAIAGMDMA